MYEIKSTLPIGATIEISDAITPTSAADLVIVDTAIEANKRESVYQCVLGEPETASSLRIGRYVNPTARNGKGTTNTSAKFEFMTQEVLNGEDVGPLEPGNVVIAFSHAGTASLNATEQAKLGKLIMMMAYQLVHGTVDQGSMTIGYDRLNALAFGITDILPIGV